MGFLSNLLKRNAKIHSLQKVEGASEDELPVYAVGDIHGCLNLLLQLEAKIFADSGDRQGVIVFLGDYIDRGPDSRGVIEHLASWQHPHLVPVFIEGNHEQVLFDFLTEPLTLQSWAQFGGLETLASYGLKPRLPVTEASAAELQQQFLAALPAHHRTFLAQLRTHFETPSLFFAHAGINPDLPLASQKTEDLLWIRDAFLNSSKRFPKRVVHGHTPRPGVEILPNRINVDTGAYVTGKLSAVAISGQTCRVLQALR